MLLTTIRIAEAFKGDSPCCFQARHQIYFGFAMYKHLYLRNRNAAPEIPAPDPDPMVISDTDDSDVEIIMVRPVVRQVEIPPESSDGETGDEETGDAESDIEDCITVIPDSPPAPVAIPRHSARNTIQECITVLPESASSARAPLPDESTKEKENMGETIDDDESHTESDSDADGAWTNSRSPYEPEASGKKQAPEAANGVYPYTRSSKRKLVDDDHSAKEIDTPTDDNRGSQERRLNERLRELGLRDLVEMFQERQLWQGEEELHRLCDRLAASRDATLTLLQQFQKVLNLWPELLRHIEDAEGLLAPLEKAWDDWATFDYRIVTFRARVRDALDRRTRRVQLGFWVDKEMRRRAGRIPQVCKTVDALESLVKRLVCGAAMASLRIDGSDAGPKRQDDENRASDETGSAMKQLELLVGELTE